MESLSQLEREESIFHEPCQIGSKEAFLRLNQEPSISLLEYKISSIFHQRFSTIIYTADHGHLKNHESYPKTTWNGLKDYSRGAENGVYGSYWSSSLFRDSPSISFFWGCFIKRKWRIGLFYDNTGSWENPRVLEAAVKNVGFTGITKGPAHVWLLCGQIS